MRVLIVSPYATVAPHFETELEIAERHLLLGDQVDWLNCIGGLSNCDFNQHKLLNKCSDCSLRRQHGISMLAKPVTVLPLIQQSDDELEAVSIRSVDQLKALVIDGFDIGYAVLSSLVSTLRDPEPDLFANKELMIAFYRSAKSVFRTVQEYLRSHDVDRVYVFNGRFAAMRGVFRACQLAGVSCQVHERGATQDQFEVYENHLPHDIPAIHQLIEDAWKNSDDIESKSSIASRWFLNRRKGIETNWISFTKEQTKSRLPDNWNMANKNIVIFSSSDDEFVAIGDTWTNSLYHNQLSGVKAICQDLLEQAPEVKIFLRMHPNLISVDNRLKQEMLELKSGNLTVLGPDDPVDSYALMDVADKVVTFGSSIGIEANFWQRPSILLGPCLYQYLDGTYRPTDHADAIDMMKADLPPLETLGSLKYGYWFNSHGIPFRYFKPESWYHGQFKGQVVYAKKPKISRWRSAINLLGASRKQKHLGR